MRHACHRAESAIQAPAVAGGVTQQDCHELLTGAHIAADLHGYEALDAPGLRRA
jgi:hypothetical protein